MNIRLAPLGCFLLIATISAALLHTGVGAETDAESLLRQALQEKQAQLKTNDGDWEDTLSLLRIAGAMRLHGMREEALKVVRETTAHNNQVNEGAPRDEIIAELARLQALLGEVDEAAALARTTESFNYDIVGIYLAAQSLAAEGNAAGFEKMARSAMALVGERSHSAQDDQWLRGLVRIALRQEKKDLALEIVEKMGENTWRASALAEFEDPALARDCPDVYVRVIASARAGEVAAALEAADRIDDAKTRDAALRVAARKRLEAGKPEDAARLAAAIADPGVRLIVEGTVVSQETLPNLLARLGEAPAEEQPLLAEALTVSCGALGLSAEALQVAEQVPEGRARFRALDLAAGALIRQGLKDEAAKLLEEAAAQIKSMDETSGEAEDAHRQLALRYHETGRPEEVEDHLSRLQPGLPLALTALATERPEQAREVIRQALKQDPEDKDRNRLIPMLVEAGDVDGALAAVAERPLKDQPAGSILAYRLAGAGEMAKAVKYAESLNHHERVEALVQIAMAPIHEAVAKDSAPADAKSPVVAVTVHGSWRAWFPRLERLGIEWALMPFSEPFELGGEGLSAKYAALGFPGGNSHTTHTAPAGVEGIRDFLDAGGGFLGICAGQFLATHSDLVPTREVYHPRGEGPHQVLIQKQHPVSFSLPPVVVITRRNGGMLNPAPGCDVVGWYDSEGRYAALVAASHGSGRVVVFSPHPEGSSGFDARDVLCNSGLHWALWGTP